MLRQLVSMLSARLDLSGENGAIGWLALGIVIGVILVIVAIVQLLIPGD